MKRIHVTVHWYDTQAHRIACGAPGQIGSTKHPRNVTCVACQEILLRRAGEPGGPKPLADATDPVSGRIMQG